MTLTKKDADGNIINDDADQNTEGKPVQKNVQGTPAADTDLKDDKTGANVKDGAPLPGPADGSKTVDSEQTGTSITTSAENLNPAAAADDPQQMSSHAKTPPEMVEPENGLNVDSIEEAAVIPLTKTGANAAQHGQPDSKAFAYRVAAWFSSIAHKLDTEEKKVLIRLKADLARRHDQLLASGETDVQGAADKLEQEAAAHAQALKDKYLD